MHEVRRERRNKVAITFRKNIFPVQEGKEWQKDDKEIGNNQSFFWLLRTNQFSMWAMLYHLHFITFVKQIIERLESIWKRTLFQTLMGSGVDFQIKSSFSTLVLRKCYEAGNRLLISGTWDLKVWPTPMAHEIPSFFVLEGEGAVYEMKIWNQFLTDFPLLKFYKHI